MKLVFNRLRSQVRSVAACTPSVLKAKCLSLPLTCPATGRPGTRRISVVVMLSLLAMLSPARAASTPTLGGGINGAVADALGRPLPNVSVELQSPNGNAVAKDESNAEGKFHLQIFKPGTYTLMTHKKGFKPAARVIYFPANNTAVDLVLEAREALNVPMKASRIRAQNGLSQLATANTP